MNSVCVFCGSNSGNGASYLLAAQRLGRIIAEKNLTLVYGGGNVGLMGELANTVLQYNGKVIGVIPQDLVARETALRDVTDLRIVNSMHERKALMSELSDGFIAMPGGIGTLEEFFEIWTWAQLGIHSKPVCLFNANNYYDLLIKFIYNIVSENFVKEETLQMILIESDPEALIEKMKSFSPVPVRKWLSKIST